MILQLSLIKSNVPIEPAEEIKPRNYKILGPYESNNHFTVVLISLSLFFLYSIISGLSLISSWNLYISSNKYLNSSLNSFNSSASFYEIVLCRDGAITLTKSFLISSGQFL